MAKRYGKQPGSNPGSPDYASKRKLREYRANLIYLIRRSIIFKKHLPVNKCLRPDLVPIGTKHDYIIPV